MFLPVGFIAETGTCCVGHLPTLRHTFASHYVMRSGSIVKLQALLGHASIRTTQIYARLASDHLVGATSLLEGLGAGFSTRQHKARGGRGGGAMRYAKVPSRLDSGAVAKW